jgi:hypothetical protein
LDWIHFFLEEHWLDTFEIDITELIKPEVMEDLCALAEFELVDSFVHLGCGVVEFVENPSVEEAQGVEFEVRSVVFEVFWELGHGEFESVPDLVAEESVADDFVNVEVDVTALDGVGEQAESEGVCTTGWDTFREFFFSFLNVVLDFGFG